MSMEAQYLADNVAGTATPLGNGVVAKALMDDQRRLVVVGGGSGFGDATAANQTNGTQKSIVRGGAKGSTAAADVTSTSVDANHQALDVTEALPPAYEDEANGVAGTAPKVAIGAAYGLSRIGNSNGANAGVLRAGQGQVKLGRARNDNAAIRFLVVVDSAATPTAASEALWWMALPASTKEIPIGPQELSDLGVYCAAGVAFAVSTGIDYTTTAGTPLVGTLATAGEHTVTLWGR